MDKYPLAFWLVFILKHMSEYGFSAIRIFPYMDQIFDAVRMQKNTSQRKPRILAYFTQYSLRKRRHPLKLIMRKLLET